MNYPVKMIAVVLMLSFTTFFKVKIVFAQKEYSKEDIIEKGRTMLGKNYRYNCFYLNTFKLEEAGFITLHFKHNNKLMSSYLKTHSKSCPENVLYDVKVYNKNYKPTKIIGAKGVNGRNANKDFWIQVSPNTSSISLSILKSKRVQNETWHIGNDFEKIKVRISKLKKAEGSTPSWQKAF